ncbi:MAG: hypothetical protein LBR15_07250 [Methanobrevibacter sp.]|nr:hypothetical protein [Candidatus Methanovirga australis]
MDEIKLLFDNAFDKLDSGRILFENGKYADAISMLYYGMIDSSTKESTYKTLVATEKFINECLIRSKTLK